MFEIEWGEEAGRLRTAAADDADWNASVAQLLVRDGDGVAVDVGCGGGGMAKALAAALPDGAEVVAIDADAEVLAQAREHTEGAVRCELGSLDDGPEEVRRIVGRPADLVWASASVHHAGDQQAAVNALAAVLGPNGRLALAEGGLPGRFLPWDLGVGEPGLEIRLEAASDRWFAGMRRALPGSVPMPYGWLETLRRAGLTPVTTRTVLIERPTPLGPEDREHVTRRLGHWVERLRAADDPTAFLSADDLAVWDQLLDPAGPHWLGNRADLTDLSARSIHIGHKA